MGDELFLDLSSAGVVDYEAPTVTESTPLAQVSLLFAVYKCADIFVVNSSTGRLIGFVDAHSWHQHQHQPQK
jgi:hypothetical protein